MLFSFLGFFDGRDNGELSESAQCGGARQGEAQGDEEFGDGGRPCHRGNANAGSGHAGQVEQNSSNNLARVKDVFEDIAEVLEEFLESGVFGFLL